MQEAIVESSLFKQFIKECEGFGISLSSKILLGVSGGVDSIVMATLFHTAGYKIAIAHVNFKLRGNESFADRDFVANWAKERNIQFFEKEEDTENFAQQNKISIELAARKIRYDWFYEVLRNEGFTYLAIAHNANDNAETLLLNLIRGTGLKGICSIRPITEINSETNCTERKFLIRPLLFAERTQIEAFAERDKIAYREDCTNKENIYKRNKIRNQIIPLLEELNPTAVKRLNLNIEYFRQAYAFEKENVAKALSNAVQTIGSFDYMSLRKSYLTTSLNIQKLPKENRYYILYSFLSDYNFSYESSCDIVKACEKESPTSKVFFSWSEKSLQDSASKFVATIERGYLNIFKGEIISDAEILQKLQLSIPAEGEYVVNFGKRFILSIKSSNEFKKAPGVLCIDADKVQFPLILRSIENGDAFSPYGLKGSKKVNDFLNDKKIDLLIKPLVTLLCNNKNRGGSIICIPGLEIENSLCVTPQTKRYLTIEFTPSPV